MPLLTGFIQNAAFLIALALIFDLRGRWQVRARGRSEALLTGGFVGLIAVATMLFPVRVEPGLVLDTRGVALSLGALAFGPGPALVGATIAGAYRALVIGGPAFPVGVTFILASVGLGLGARLALCKSLGRPLRDTPAWAFTLLGLAVGLLQLGLVAWLLRDLETDLVARLAGPILTLNGIATTVLGLLLKARRIRLKTERDLAEREATFRTLTEQLPAIVYRASLDASSSTLYVSPAVADLGYSREEWMADAGLWARLLHPDDAERVLATLAADRASGRPSDLSYRLRTAQGDYRHFQDAAQIVRTPEGHPLYLQGVMTDITDRLDLERQYRQAQKMEGIGRLAGGIAHDLNNLLTVINGTVELALPSADQVPGLRGDLLEIRRATDRAASLTRQLLAFSRQQVLRIEVLDVNRIARDLVKMLARVIGEDVRVDTRFADTLGHIRADAGQLEQVLMNLAVNARDAMPHGGTLTIETRDVDLDAAFAARHVTVTPGPHICIVVRDTGVGMDAATQARIFEPFFTTKEAGKGTGLGLSTVYGIVKQTGGSIWVESAPDKGTSFTLYFPRVDADIVEQSSAPHARLAQGGTETILVVEDEPAIRAVAVRVLTKLGYTVLEAASGEEALERAMRHEGPLDLLVTDMVMPGMTGPELAAALRERQPSLRVLFTSGYSADAVASKFGLQDEAHFIAKPYALAELAREVRRVLALPV